MAYRGHVYCCFPFARLAKLPVFAKIASGAGVGSGSGDRG